jgi:hypothetical protein
MHRSAIWVILGVVAGVSLAMSGPVLAHKLRLSQAERAALKNAKRWGEKLASARGTAVTATSVKRCPRISAHRVVCRTLVKTAFFPVDEQTGERSPTPHPLECRRKVSVRYLSPQSRRLQVRAVRGSSRCTPGALDESFKAPPGSPPSQPAIPPDQFIPWPDFPQ